MKGKSLVVLLCLLCSGVAVAQEVYSWVDGAGARHYSDKPPRGMQLTPVKVKVAQPAQQAQPSSEVAAVQSKPATSAAAQKAAEEQNRVQRASDCEVAKNNLKLLDDPNTQVVEKGQEGTSQPMDNAARIEAHALADRQVQDFCHS